MTEDKILAGNFLFVSYSHLDMDAVKQDVQALHKRGARLWFDEHMRLSDNWKEIAEEKISHPNCKGVIFYNSKNAVLSGAVSLERRHTVERRKKDVGFGYWSVNLGAKTMQEIYAEALPSAPPNFLPVLSDELLPMFNDDILYIPRENSDSCTEIIYEQIAKSNLIIDDEGLVLKKLEDSRIASKDTGRIRFGAYIGGRYSMPLKHAKANGRFTVNDIEFISHDNELFTLRPLHWKLLYVENAVAHLLCDEIIDYYSGGEKAAEFLKNNVYEIAFSEKEKKALNSRPRLLTPDDIEKTKDKSVLSLSAECNPRQSHWWIGCAGLLENWQATCCNGIVYKNGFLLREKKGIRPVIELTVEQLNHIKEKSL